MSRLRASVAVASLVASLVMTAGVTIATTQSAVAAPTEPYPPTAPALTVNRGSVQVGNAVRASGNGFRPSERVLITILYRPPRWDHFETVQSYDTHADRQGEFSVRAEMHLPGTAIILAQGIGSGRTASATVRVTRRGHGDGNWVITNAGYTVDTGSAAAPSKPGSTSPGIALAGLGVLALAGSAALTRRTMRRRRAAAGQN
jgi:hypothetical protein